MRVPAKQKLQTWLTSKGWSQTKLAGLVGVKQSAVSRWCDESSKDRPTGPRQELLEALTGIPRDEWLTAKERRDASKVEGAIRRAGAA